MLMLRVIITVRYFNVIFLTGKKQNNPSWFIGGKHLFDKIFLLEMNLNMSQIYSKLCSINLEMLILVNVF